MCASSLMVNLRYLSVTPRYLFSPTIQISAPSGIERTAISNSLACGSFVGVAPPATVGVGDFITAAPAPAAATISPAPTTRVRRDGPGEVSGMGAESTVGYVGRVGG